MVAAMVVKAAAMAAAGRVAVLALCPMVLAGIHEGSHRNTSEGKRRRGGL